MRTTEKNPSRLPSTAALSVLAFAIAATSLAACDTPNAENQETLTAEALRSRRPPSPAPAPAPAPTPPPATPLSAACPGNDGTCASSDQNKLVCTDVGGRYSCVAPAGTNVCSNGQICPVGTVCGLTSSCNFETGICSFRCYTGGPVLVGDAAVGRPCSTVDVHGVTHFCASGLCSGGTQPVCLAAPPPPQPPINQG